MPAIAMQKRNPRRSTCCSCDVLVNKRGFANSGDRLAVATPLPKRLGIDAGAARTIAALAQVPIVVVLA